MGLDSFMKGGARAASSESQGAPQPQQAEQSAAASTTGEAPPTERTAESDASPGIDETSAAGLKQALLAERKKRQDKERDLEARERELADYRSRPLYAPQPQAAPPPEKPWEWTEDAVLSDLPGSFRRVEEREELRYRARRFKASEELARLQFQDYDETLKLFPEVTRHNRGLLQEIEQSEMPALYAYHAIKRHAEAAKHADPTQREAQIEAEVKKRVEAALAKERSQSAAESVPVSLTTVRGSGAATPKPKTWAGPKPLSAIVAKR